MKTKDLFLMINAQGAMVFPSAIAMAYYIETEDQDRARTCCSPYEFSQAYEAMNLHAIDLFVEFTRALGEYRIGSDITMSSAFPDLQQAVDKMNHDLENLKSN